MCEHHMLPFIGRAHVAYIPKGGRDGPKQNRPRGRCFIKTPSGPGTPYYPYRRSDYVEIEATWCHGCPRGRAPLHVDARRGKAGDHNDYQCGQGDF